MEEGEFRLPLTSADFKAQGTAVVDAFSAEVLAGGFAGWRGVAENHEGFRAAIDEGAGRAGWALLRQSLHDPLLVLNVESETPGGAAAAAHAMLCWLEAHAAGVDVSALEKAFTAEGMFGADAARECALHHGRGQRLGGGNCGEVGEACNVDW